MMTVIQNNDQFNLYSTNNKMNNIPTKLPTATHLSYLQHCHRKVWLFSNGISMEQNSQLVLEGKLISETTYMQRPDQYTELALGPIKIDFFDTKNKVVYETKKSDKREAMHLAQVKYYLYILKLSGIEGATGIIEYPKQRKKVEVFLTENDEILIQQQIKEVNAIINQENSPPALTKLSACKNCAYFDLCHIQ